MNAAIDFGIDVSAMGFFKLTNKDNKITLELDDVYRALMIYKNDDIKDEEIDAVLAQMGATDYTPDEYDFFFRNCNHFCYDLAERLADGGWSESDAAYIENHVLHESEAILSDMPLGTFQQDLTRKVTTQVQKAVINAWRTDWRKSLAEYEEEQGIPSELRIVAPSELV